MKVFLSFSDIAERPGLLIQITGAALVLAAAVCFFAWNWQALPQALRLVLPGACTILSLFAVPLAEARQKKPYAALALVTAALFTGLFWTSFGQIFQSGATARELCLAWAVSITPIFLLRPTAALWNLLILLLCIFAFSGPVLTLQDGAWTSHVLPLLLVSGAGCLIALLPPRSPRPYCLNAWLALPLAVLLATSTAVCSLNILFRFYQYAPSLPETAAASLALAIVFLLALYHRHALALCGVSLSLLILLNMLLFRTLENTHPYETAAVFTAVNIGFTFLLAMLLPKALSLKEHPRIHGVLTRIPSLTGGFLSALSLFLLSFFFFNEFSIRGHAMLQAGLVYMAGGMLLWRVRGKNMFLSVLASVLVSGGSLCFHIDLLGYSPTVLLASIWAAAVLIYLLMDYAPLRFSAVFWADITTLFILPSLLPANFPCSVTAFLLFFLPLFAATAGRFPRGFLRPASFACIFTLLFITPSFPPLTLSHISIFSLEKKIIISIAALNLAAQLGRMFTLHSGGKKTALWEYAVLMFLLIPVWYLSTLENLIALNLIAAGFAGYSFPADAGEPGTVRIKSDKTAVLFGIIQLSVGLLLFYYFSDLSFPAKTYYTGIPGMFLFCAGMWMGHRHCSPCRRKEESRNFCTPALRPPLPFVLCGAILVVMFTTAVADRKALLREGDEMLLALVPKDPRAFMLGDYLALSYDMERQLSRKGEAPSCLPLTVDEKGVAHPSPDGIIKNSDCTGVPFPAVRVENSPLGGVNLRLPHRYYFEQGLAPLYAPAAFAILRCDKNNDCLLQGLADADKRPILAPHP